MVDRKPIFVVVDGLNRPTELSEFGTDDVIPVVNGGTGATSIQAATGLVYNPTAGTLTTADDVDEFTLVGGGEKLIARHINVANDLSAGPSCETLLDGTVSISSSLSTGPDCLVQFNGTFSAMSGICVSGAEGVSSNDAGKAFYLRRDAGASYQNLIRAEDGTVTIQAEDDVHLKSNTGEDFARFNENAAVWLYHNNSKKIETHADGAVVNGTLSATTGMESSGCPVPQPFGYMQLDSDGTDSVDETNLGAGATVTNIVSNTDHISWNDTGKYFNVSAAGVYEVLGVVILEGGSTLVDLSIQKNGSDVLVGQPRVHSTVDPLEHTIRAVFTCAASDYVSITYDATASNSVKAITGSTMSVKRLK